MTDSSRPPPTFASDNWSGLCPESLEALVAANQGSQPPYGGDESTQRAVRAIQTLFDTDADVFFVSSGTAANSLALAHLTAPYHSVLCHGLSHILLDECGAPGFFGHGVGIKSIGHSEDAKIQNEDLEKALELAQDLRFQPPSVLSLTQSTERGTLYSIERLRGLIATAKKQGLRIHMDGARFLQAIAALDISPAEMSWQSGVDVLTLGASKLGGGLADAVIFFDRRLADGFAYRLKQAGQVPAKFRLWTAPWVGLLASDAWHRYARHANAMASDLEKVLGDLDFPAQCPRESNMLFVRFSEREIIELHQRGWAFHVHPETGLCRLVSGWDSTRDYNLQLAEAIRSIRKASH